MTLSIVIVNYNVQYFLEQCLHSVYRSGKGLDMEVFVVDNQSVDGSVEMVREKFPQVRLIANKENLGFSKANNQAIRRAVGRYVLLLNPDTVVEDDTLTRVVRFMDEHPDAGALGVKMLDGRGRFLPESKRGLPKPGVAFCKIFGLSALFPKSKLFSQYHLGYLDKDQTHQVDVLSGAFMLLRKEALEKTGLLDEAFFMYGEDVDLSYRITQAGYRNYYYPGTRIIHYKGESTRKSSVNYVLVFYNAMVVFARKHFSRKNARAFSLLINLAIYFRAFIALLSRFFRRIFWPLLDSAVIFGGFYYLKNYWGYQVLSVESAYYPPEFMRFFVPAYILFWVTATYFSGGYDKPLRLYRLVRGVGLGTIAILVIYALLPADMRFSRALILLGSVWAVFSMILTRTLHSLVRYRSLKLGGHESKRVLIAGEGKEADRILKMLRQSGLTSFIGLVSLKDRGKQDEGYLGSIHQVNEIIDIYQINEVIFCAGEMPAQSIIDQMSKLQDKAISFKIAPPESLYIIGSNSIDTFGDLFTINVNAINLPANRRNKRLFDISLSLLLLLSLPLHLLLQKNKSAFLKNLFLVLAGRKSWVGYHPTARYNKLPALKHGVLYPDDAIPHKMLAEETLNNLNGLYAKDYKLETDLQICLKAYRAMGRKVKKQ